MIIRGYWTEVPECPNSIRRTHKRKGKPLKRHNGIQANPEVLYGFPAQVVFGCPFPFAMHDNSVYRSSFGFDLLIKKQVIIGLRFRLAEVALFAEHKENSPQLSSPLLSSVPAHHGGPPLPWQMQIYCRRSIYQYIPVTALVAPDTKNLLLL